MKDKKHRKHKINKLKRLLLLLKFTQELFKSFFISVSEEIIHMATVLKIRFYVYRQKK
jgi:hypothetical protein